MSAREFRSMVVICTTKIWSRTRPVTCSATSPGFISIGQAVASLPIALRGVGGLEQWGVAGARFTGATEMKRSRESPRSSRTKSQWPLLLLLSSSTVIVVISPPRAPAAVARFNHGHWFSARAMEDTQRSSVNGMVRNVRILGAPFSGRRQSFRAEDFAAFLN